jgi:hypothetical protein
MEPITFSINLRNFVGKYLKRIWGANTKTLVLIYKMAL